MCALRLTFQSDLASAAVIDCNDGNGTCANRGNDTQAALVSKRLETMKAKQQIVANRARPSQNVSCPTGYIEQDGILSSGVGCLGSANWCVLPCQQAFEWCDSAAECGGVSETTNAGWTARHSTSCQAMSGTVRGNREWKTCVKAPTQTWTKATNWLLGGLGQNCEDACTSYGRVCDRNEMAALGTSQGDLSSVLGPLDNEWCASCCGGAASALTSSAAPYVTNGNCVVANPISYSTQPWDFTTCNASLPSAQRICYCQAN